MREVEFVKDNFLNIFLVFFLPRFFSFLCTVSFIKTGAVDTLVGRRGVRTIVKSFPTADAGGGVPTVDDDCVRLVPIVVRPRRWMTKKMSVPWAKPLARNDSKAKTTTRLIPKKGTCSPPCQCPRISRSRFVTTARYVSRVSQIRHTYVLSLTLVTVRTEGR